MRERWRKSFNVSQFGTIKSVITRSGFQVPHKATPTLASRTCRTECPLPPRESESSSPRSVSSSIKSIRAIVRRDSDNRLLAKADDSGGFCCSRAVC